MVNVLVSVKQPITRTRCNITQASMCTKLYHYVHVRLAGKTCKHSNTHGLREQQHNMCSAHEVLEGSISVCRFIDTYQLLLN